MKYLSNILVNGKARGELINITENMGTANFKENIIVCKVFVPKLYIYLSNCKGIIIEKGGILCHAAIVARESNIPCVRIENATKIFKTGQKIEIKENGEIILL